MLRARSVPFLASLLVMMALVLPLSAQEQQEELPYAPFKLTVPEGWSVSYSPGNGQVGQSLHLTSPDSQAQYTIELQALSPGQWNSMFNDMSLRPAPDHGIPSQQCSNEDPSIVCSSFIVPFNEASTGMAGRKIYEQIRPDKYVLQTITGYHDDLGALINGVEIVLPATQ